jgi:hypothetical protein
MSAEALHHQAKSSHPVPATPAQISEAEIEEIIDVAPFDNERTIHVRLAEGQVGICQELRNDVGVRDADCNEGCAVTDVLETAIRADEHQCALADDLSKDRLQ